MARQAPALRAVVLQRFLGPAIFRWKQGKMVSFPDFELVGDGSKFTLNWSRACSHNPFRSKQPTEALIPLDH
jgi:hypothetical protein